MKTLAIANQKGGTGKTTTAVTAAYKLAQDDRRVLLVDTDPQGHVAVTLGLEKAPGIRQLINRAQYGRGDLQIVQARPNLDVLPSDKTTEQAKLVLAGMSFREQVLATQLQSLAHYYDVVIIDCAPSVDVLHVSALVAADYLVIPTKLSFLAVDGVSEMLRSVLAIRTSNPDLAPSVICILPTFFERTTRETVAQLRSLTTHFARLVWPPIPVDVKLREAPVFGKTIWEHAPRSRSIVGIETSSNGRRYGGYADFVERLEQYL